MDERADHAAPERPRIVATTGEPQLQLEGVSRSFKGVSAVSDVNFEVHPGEVFALLGPSGCGKSTTLRMIAGLEKLDQGVITMSGRVLADGDGKQLVPEKRNIAMVFQSYAVWPHMTVRRNVEFPLKMRKVPRAERKELVEKVLEVTGLSSYAERPATMLSGGQQQRVALARALVYAPGLLLLDEPLSNLDAKLRVQMRQELRRINEDLAITMLFVTHDQDEALSLADRIAVMNNGVVEQVGTPAEMYENPRTPFVRDFLGRMVVVEGTVSRAGDDLDIRLDIGGSVCGVPGKESISVGDRVGVFVRPEDVELIASDGRPLGPNQVAATVTGRQYLGQSVEYEFRLGEKSVVVEAPRRTRFDIGDEVLVDLAPEQATVWPL
jgi:ABC-type Fe3+/spermidine/putrescine transport system ATPase subunit